MSSQTAQQALPTGSWRGDSVHSTVGFAVVYMAGTFQGTFSAFDARLSDGVLRGTAEVASVQVKDPNLEAHLQGPEFFDAERFPQLSFDAKEVSRSGDDLTLVGDLTLKGHTEEVEIKGHINDPAPDPYGGERVGLPLQTTGDRTKLCLERKNPRPSRGPAPSNHVPLILLLPAF